MYENELKALKKADRFRERKIYEDLEDYASNDYLGLAEDKEILEKTCNYLKKSKTHGSKASQLVNGYHPIHKKFEEYLCKTNGFEKGVILGSGYLANLALFETLPRRGDLLLVDEEYHASGIVGTKLCQGKVVFFNHNDEKDLKKKIEENSYKRLFIAVEGVYSMSGDLLNKKIIKVCDENSGILIADEAHSSGVLGKNLNGIFDHFGIKPKKNHIKMGTLGKAYGSYGAYILANEKIVSFLENRAKSLIYATSPSIYDIAYGYYSAKKIQKNREVFGRKIKTLQELAFHILAVKTDSLILPIEVNSSKESLEIQEILKENGYLVGAIRPPTVVKPILRVILRINNSNFQDLFDKIREIKVKGLS